MPLADLGTFIGVVGGLVGTLLAGYVALRQAQTARATQQVQGAAAVIAGFDLLSKALEERIRANEKEIADLRAELAELRMENEALRDRIQELEKENAALHAQLTKLEQKRARARKGT